MFQSQLFGKTLRKPPKEAVIPSHQLLVKGGFINQLAAGIWSFLPLGFRVFKKIEEIIRVEMENLGAQEVFLPSLQPKEIWRETDRWKTIDPPLFKLQDRRERELALGPTHEEVITDLARHYITSYKELPLALFQIQNKFRNEMRASGGLLRVREFVMKDLYSFHQDEKNLDKYYREVLKAYQKIYQRCDLEVQLVEALPGSIGGSESHEFMVLSETGEDKIVKCQKCKFAVNLEIGKKYKACPKCQGKLLQKNTIEVGHIFKLGAKYSQTMKANFIDKNGKKRPILMGCYGIGLGRLMATVVEVHHDKNGIIWPKSVAPFDLHLLNLTSNSKSAQKLRQTLQNKGFEVLYDDRDESPGVKLKDADLLGIPWRLVISDKIKPKIELKKRSEEEMKILLERELVKFLEGRRGDKKG